MTYAWFVLGGAWALVIYGWGYRHGRMDAHRKIARGLEPIDFGNGVRLTVCLDEITDMIDAAKREETVN